MGSDEVKVVAEDMDIGAGRFTIDIDHREGQRGPFMTDLGTTKHNPSSVLAISSLFNQSNLTEWLPRKD